jgi:hypothetical protein
VKKGDTFSPFDRVGNDFGGGESLNSEGEVEKPDFSSILRFTGTKGRLGGLNNRERPGSVGSCFDNPGNP